MMSLLVISGVALAAPHGPTAAAGVVITPSRDLGGATLRPLTGPVLEGGYQLGDWLNHEFLVQFTTSLGGVVYDDVPLDGGASLVTAAGGYRLRLDVFGKEGRGGFTPFLGGGLLIGAAKLSMNTSSDDPDLQQELVDQGFAHRSEVLPFLELHAVLGLRCRVADTLGVRAEIASSTYGGITAWQPKLGFDKSFGAPRERGAK